MQNSLGHPIGPVRALGGPKSVAGYIAVHCVGWVVPFGASKAIQVIPPSVPPSASIGRVGRNTGETGLVLMGVVVGRRLTCSSKGPIPARSHPCPPSWAASLVASRPVSAIRPRRRRNNPLFIEQRETHRHANMTALEALLVLPLLHYKAAAVRRALPVPLWLPAACILNLFSQSYIRVQLGHAAGSIIFQPLLRWQDLNKRLGGQCES